MARPTPHDTLFQHLLSFHDTVVSALSSWLPPALAASIDWSTLRPEPTVTADVFHGELRSDRVFSLRTTGGAPALLHVHLEHQSRIERDMAVRCAEYQLRIVRAWQRAQRKASGRAAPSELPAVISIVVYHGASTWSAPTSLEGLVHPATAEALGPLQHRLSFLLVDLTAVPEEVLTRGVRQAHLALGLLLLRAAAARAGGWERLREWLGLLAAVTQLDNGPERLRALLGYAGNVFGNPTRAVYDEILAGVPEEGRGAMLTWEQTIEQRGIEKGIEKGLEKGLEKGRKEGREEGLERGGLIGELLTWVQVRWGAPTSELRARIAAAPLEDLRRWRAHVETAERLETLLAEPS